MVGHFHCQLKSALATLKELIWMEALQIIFLDIWTDFKADDCSTPKLVYGTTLRLPKFFTVSAQDRCTAIVAYAFKLANIMEKLCTMLPPRGAPQAVYVPSESASCTHVLVCHDVVHYPRARLSRIAFTRLTETSLLSRCRHDFTSVTQPQSVALSNTSSHKNTPWDGGEPPRHMDL